MADNTTIIFNQVQKAGTFGNVVDLINANFNLARLAILNMKGKSAYEMWREEEGNENKTESEFWAFLTADKGYTKQAVTLAQFNALDATTANTNIIYVHPNSNNTEYYAKVSNGTTWVTLLVNDGDITNLSDRIGEIEGNIGSVVWEDILFTTDNGLVSSVDGSISENDDYKYTEIDLTDTEYSRLSFNTRGFSGNYGYAFLVGSTWQGTKTTAVATIDVEIPEGATAFRLCWYKTQSQNIKGKKSHLVTDGLQKQIEENSNEINKINDSVTDLYSKLGTESYNTIPYTEISGHVVNSDNGSLIETEGYASVEIPLTGTSFTKIKFQTWKYGGNRGYGFVFSDGHWEGVHTTTVQEIIVDVPANAVTFKTCWSTQTSWFTQNIEGCVEDSVFVGLQRQIDDNVSSIDNLNTSISDLSKKLGSDVWDDVEFTANVGLVNSNDGTIDTTSSSSSGYRYAVVDLSNGEYKKISFKPQGFKGYFGYGFVLSNGDWIGTRGTITSDKPIEIEVPNNAVAFKTCWYYTKDQEIKTLETQDNYTNLQEQVENLREEIENNSNVIYIIKPFAISVPDCREIIPNLTVSSVYELWDALISQYPDYLTSTELGYEQSNTYKMRKIEFGIKDNNSNNNELVLKKVMVTANIHGWSGDSHIPAYMMYWLTKFILDNKATNELAQWILSNFYFVIIPIANPWGFNNRTRGNSRNIDLNRNFDADFVPNADPYNIGVTSGATAASEAETQHIQSVIDANTDLWMFVDFHSQPATQPLVSKAPKAGRMQYLPNSADMVLRKQCEKALYYGKIVANDWIENIATSTGGQSMRYAYKHLSLKRVITLEAAGHPDEKTNNGTTWDYFNTKAMTGVARLFLSLLRFEN